MKAWSVIGPLFAAAILATIPKNGPGDDMPAPGRNYLRAPSAPELRVPLWVFIQVPKNGAARIPDTRDLGFRKGLNRQFLQPAMEGLQV